jgi:hypothetical protein
LLGLLGYGMSSGKYATAQAALATVTVMVFYLPMDGWIEDACAQHEHSMSAAAKVDIKNWPVLCCICLLDSCAFGW